MATCPTCDRDDFDSETGVKIHHVQAHGESIAGVEAECVNCGETFRGKRSRIANRQRTFCSPECQHEWRSENFTGESNPAWSGGNVETECAACGEEIVHLGPERELEA